MRLLPQLGLKPNLWMNIKTGRAAVHLDSVLSFAKYGLIIDLNNAAQVNRIFKFAAEKH